MLQTNHFRRNALMRSLAMFSAGMAVVGMANAANCADTPVSGKRYYIVNEGSGLQIDVPGWSNTDGVGVIQWSSLGGPYNFAQQFTVESVGSGLWSLRPVHSGKSLDVYNFSNADGGAIVQWPYTGNPNQQWVITPDGTGSHKIMSNFSKKFFTVADTKAGTALQQSADQSSLRQKWYFNPVDGACKSLAFNNFMGYKKVLIGGTMPDAAAASAPFDARYAYIASNPMPEDMCARGAKEAGWWGCWSEKPGGFVKYLLNKDATATWENKSTPRLTVLTYYVMKKAAGAEGSAEAHAMNNASVLKRYLNYWRFLLQTIGNERAMLQIEPDLWGFVRSVNIDPHAVPAQLKAANPTDCAWHEDSAAGVARCMISMARKYAPNVSVGLHASPWTYMAPGDGEVTGRYMAALGAGDGDFVTTDPSDRDAGYHESQGKNVWWNDEKFAGYLAWSKKLAEIVGKPTVMWQVPLGNWGQNNTVNHWKDNKVDYLFSRINDVANAHVAALLFGAGNWDQTSPEFDGGNLFWKTKDYISKGGVNLR